MIWPAITHRIKINFKESLERYSTDGGSLHLSQDTYIPILNDIIKIKKTELDKEISNLISEILKK